MIDTSGTYWTGEDLADLSQYLRAYEAEGYAIDHVAECVCAACDGRAFRLVVDANAGGGAQRTCANCATAAYIADSEDYWDEAGPEPVTCPCGNDTFQLAVGFALRADKNNVTWISVGRRCQRDGTLGCPQDWKIDYRPSLHLLDQA